MALHGHDHNTHNSHGREDPEERAGLLGFLGRVSDVRERVGSRVREGVEATGRQLAAVPGLLDRGMRHIGENPLDFLPITGEARSLQDARQAFSQGRPGLGLLAAAGALPGVPRVKPLVRGLFSGLEELKGSGLRIFARSEGPGARTVASITPSTRGGFKISIFEETAEQGSSNVPINTIDFDTMDEAVEAIEGGRGFFKGLKEVPIGPENVMESRFERIAERGLFPRTAQARARAEARRTPESVGGFAP